MASSQPFSPVDKAVSYTHLDVYKRQPLAAAFANRVGSAYHAELLEKSLPADIAWYGHLPRDADAAMPERHLGLLPAAEIDDLLQRIERMACLLYTSRCG